MDGRHYQAKVIGGDEWCDAAVLKIESRDKFQPIKLGACLAFVLARVAAAS